jgi:hypothetical protein
MHKFDDELFMLTAMAGSGPLWVAHEDAEKLLREKHEDCFALLAIQKRALEGILDDLAEHGGSYVEHHGGLPKTQYEALLGQVEAKLESLPKRAAQETRWGEYERRATAAADRPKLLLMMAQRRLQGT